MTFAQILALIYSLDKMAVVPSQSQSADFEKLELADFIERCSV